METKYPSLKRPKRKLCYFSDKERPTKQWTGMLSLGDIDRMFDDLEPSDHEEDVVLPSSPLLLMDDTEGTQGDMAPSPVQQQESHSSEDTQKCHKSPKGCSHRASPSPQRDVDLDSPSQGPVKTSSPIEERKAGGVSTTNTKDKAVSPILFLSEDDREPANPCSSSKKDPVINKANLMAELKSRLTPPRPEKTKSVKHVVAHTPEDIKAGDVHIQPSVERPRQVDTSMFTFLQKRRDTQPAPSSSRKPVSPVNAHKVPEEDFFILEDEAPLLFRIPRTMLSSKRHSGTSGAVFDSQTSQKSPRHPSQTVEKEQQFTDRSPVNKLKKNTKRVKKTNIPEPLDSQPENLSPPADHAVVERLVHEKPIKKQSRVKQVYSEKNDTMDVTPQDPAANVSTDSEETPRKVTKKSQKTLKAKKPKAIKHRKEVDKKKTAGKPGRKGAQVVKKMPQPEAGIEDHQEHSSEEHGQADPALLSGDNKTKEKQKQLPVLLEESSSMESQIGGRRQRRPPGQWWMSSTLGSEGADVTERQPLRKKLKLSHAESKQSPAKRKKVKDSERRNEKEPPPSSSQKKSQVGGKNINGGQVRAKPRKTKTLQNKFGKTETEQIEVLDTNPLNSSSSLLPLQGHSSSSGDQIFQNVLHNSSAKKTSTPASTSAKMCREQPQETSADKRRRKAPCDWWVVGNQVEEVSPLPQPQQVKHVKGRKNVRQSKASGLGSPISGNVAVSLGPAGGAPGPSVNFKSASSKKASKRSLAPFMDSFPAAIETPSKASRKVSSPSSKQEVSERRDCSPHRTPEAQDASGTDSCEPNGNEGRQNNRNHSDNTSKVIRSGPSSMIQLDDYPDNEMTLPSSRFNTVLSVSDLCAPPLEPLVLQPKDKGNLSEWFRTVWSVESGADISPDQFDWYFYQGRAFGIHVDLNSGTLCSGKMLLGSYMKKPLWVDHSATTVFHLLTSSVNVVINGSGSRFHPAQAFQVPCGHAYSIQNVSAQPAVLYFTRMFSESSD